MTCYNDIDEWESQWERRIMISEFTLEWHGSMWNNEDGHLWTAVTYGTDRHGEQCEFFGVGDTKEDAIQDWWENRLNALAPEEVYNSVMAIKAGYPQSFPEDE